MENRKSIQSKYYNIGAKDLPPLKTGDTVRIKPQNKRKQWQKARVEDQVNIRSYNVMMENGGVYRRNRVQLRHTPENFNEPIRVEYPDQHEIRESQIEDQELNIAPTIPDSYIDSGPSSHTDSDSGQTTEIETGQHECAAYQRPSRGALKPARYRDPDYVYS